MPTPLSPSSSQEIIPISPPLGTSSFDMIRKGKLNGDSRRSAAQSDSRTVSTQHFKSTSTSTIPHRIITTSASERKSSPRSSSSSTTEINPRAQSSSNKPIPSLASVLHRKPKPLKSSSGSTPIPNSSSSKSNYQTNGHQSLSDIKGKRKAEDEEQRDEFGKKSRAQVMEYMLNTRGEEKNPVTNSDLYSRTDHFVSCSTGHQQSNREGGSAGAMTYWQVRTAQMDRQSREKQSDLLKGCLFYINGTTGPKVSNIQLRNLITTNGGRFSPVQTASCTHIIANGGLSGSKSQKHIDGQGGRGAARRAKVVSVEWVIDSVEKGVKLSEAGYSMIKDPSQPNLFKTLGVKPKLESEVRADKS
ncbi:hypothetical protein IAR55_000225 [Kwoniella newhampshirensis]|uniref:BRCT domain-containing protein n=1 Tax=Kwoniella newhampshirensis TaxID=1651941 RepID=A0AAW0Z621_9TREE